MLADADSMGDGPSIGGPDITACCAGVPNGAAAVSGPPRSRRPVVDRPVVDRPYGCGADVGVSEPALWRRLIAEGLGCVFLGAIVVGSGIAAQQLSPGATGLELLENAAATAAGLYAIILMFGGVSGAHFNPVVSFVDAVFGGLRWRDAVRTFRCRWRGASAGPSWPT